ncbi:hypothetical protein APHAL10511_005042 [Amanita phalloides]|nr:hypothetical protein APHAL10511_005042 [Amanita phalloides]
MVVLAASICTKGGKPVISRQFRDMTRTRIESLLASFPKLIPTNTQHTSVETADVRYVYQPLEDLYILLITNKASNILQDIDTLHLFARVVSDICRSADEREILKNAFGLLGAFDEIVSLGYREQVNLMQVRSILEMESHEEKIQEIIARNKEAEAKEELKRRAKQLEMQRREQQRRTAGVGGGSYMGGGVTGYSPVARFEAPEPVNRITTASPATTSPRAPAFKGSGMKLGARKTKQAELLDALGGEAVVPSPEISAPQTPVAAPELTLQKTSERGSLPEVSPESVHIVIKETVSLSLLRDGGVQSMELKGEMILVISDLACAHIKLALEPLSADFGNALQFKQHPNVSKFAPGQERVIALKDPSKVFPVNTNVAVLKWRYAGKDESNVPLSITCWPAPNNDGTCEVSMEYELENENVTLYDVVILIPLPDGSYPTVSSHTGEWALDASSHSLAWSIPVVSSSDDSQSGSLVFTIGGDEAGLFFPVKVSFTGQGSLAGVNVASAKKIDGDEDAAFSVDALVMSLLPSTTSSPSPLYSTPFLASSISSCPQELLDEIVHYLSSSELIVLCLTSKQLYSVALRLLYRVITLSTPSQAVKFCKSLLSRQPAAFSVRRLLIDFVVRHLSQNFFKLLASALRRMVYLESLDISNALPLLVLLCVNPFSNLKQCSLPYSPHLAPFLQSHPSIHDLVIQPPTRVDLLRLVSDVFPYILLPNLDTFVGPSKVAKFVIPYSNVFHVTVFWDFDPPPEEVLPSLALSNRSVSVLDNIVVQWDCGLFTAIATSLPRVVMLRIRNASSLDDDVQPFLDHVESLLPNFQVLMNLGISHIYSVPISVDDLDHEHDTVTRWGHIIPSLQFCTLPSGTRWSRYRPDAWFPDRGGPYADTKAQWLFRAILAVKFPLDMYADIQDAEGQALVSKLRELRDRGVEYPVLVLGETYSLEEVVTNQMVGGQGSGNDDGNDDAVLTVDHFTTDEEGSDDGR